MNTDELKYYFYIVIGIVISGYGLFSLLQDILYKFTGVWI